MTSSSAIITEQVQARFREGENMSSLLKDLRKLDLESYQGYDSTILKYALSLLEIIANDRQTRLTIGEFEQLPDKLELSEGLLIPGRWSHYRDSMTG